MRLTSVIFVCLMVCPCFGQDEIVEGDKVYRLVPSGNGVAREFVGRTTGPRHRINPKLASIYTHPGLPHLFEHLDASDAGLLASDDITEEQAARLQETIRSFRESAQKGDGNIHVLRAEFVSELQDILIPEQLNDILDRYGNPNLLMSRILGTALGASLELSEDQKGELLGVCKEVNGEIEELKALIKAKEVKLKEKLSKAYREKLTAKQQRRFERTVNFDRVLKAMQLDDVHRDTGFQGTSK